MAVLIFAFLDYGRPWGAMAYVMGAVLSGLAGFIGMTVATMANARTTQAARTGPQLALPLAFRGGAVMGFSVAGLSLLGLSLSYILFVDLLEVDQPFQVVTAFGLGASSIALFSRVGGGIYTKAVADNSGGIAETAHLPPEVRAVTDSLDSLGNTTAAIAKGFALGSAAITALALFKAFEQAVFDAGGTISLDIGDVSVFVGLFLGAMTVPVRRPHDRRCRPSGQPDDRRGPPAVPGHPRPA